MVRRSRVGGRLRGSRVLTGTLLVTLLLGGCVFGGGTSHEDEAGSPPRSAGSTGAPAVPPVKVCGKRALLRTGPATPPPGAVVVPAGDNSGVDFHREGRTFWFAPGVHTLGSGQFDQIFPADGTRYVGAPGAVLDGQRANRYAFTGRARNVVVEYLTIQHFGAAGDNGNEGVVNHDSGPGWTIRHNTIRDNAGAGMMLGRGNVARYNCVTRNGQYGFNAYSSRGAGEVTFDHNEVSYNNTDDWEARVEGCGCTGGGKFWSVTGATVTDNYVHDNRGVGLWADNNNSGFLVAGNYVADNDDVGIFYETSYNALIQHNTVLRNALVAGPENPGFPTGGIYVSESGADPRVGTRYRTALEIRGNLLEDNWSGVVLWENADRYCGSAANSSTGECTLVNPGVVTARTCNPATIDAQPYYDDCRWKTQNVKVHDNLFRTDPAAIGPECTFVHSCGVSGVFSNSGSFPDWSPYQGPVVQKAITYHQGNRFYDNTYEGAWRFLPFDQGNLVTFEEWQSRYGQDAGSALAAAPGS